MAFVKILKTSSYHSRFQVKYRRRREGRTDYQARRNLCRQEKTKYNTPKYRFIVRFSNQRVIAQIAYATIQGDRIVCAADSTELSRYGMPVGQTNYAAAYATGLLLARRLCKQLNLEQEGVTEPTGEEYHVEDEDCERRPFKAVLDIGLVHTTTGHRVFGALKGAVDGGIAIPHSTKRFPGYTRGEEGAADNYDAEVHRKRIFAGHVASYMAELQEENPERYEAQFSRYIKAGITSENLEEKIAAMHAAIRADPSRVKTEKKPVPKPVRDNMHIVTIGKDGKEVRYLRPRKLTKAERAARVQIKLQKIIAAREAEN